MNVSAVVAGYETTWRFRDSRKVDAWLASQTWRGGGGVVTIRVASSDQSPATIAALAKAARAADEHGDVRVLTIRSENLKLGIGRAIAQSLELTDSEGRSETLRRVIDQLHGPHLFVAEPAEGREVGQVFDDAARFRDEVTRTSPDLAIAIVLTEVPSHPVSVESMDLSVGAPADSLLNLLDGPEAELWRAYVHARLAWEVAGDLSRAEFADRLEFAGLRVGQDNELERRLNLFAEDCALKIGDKAAEVSKRFLTSKEHSPREASTSPSSAEMETSGLFWRPPGETLSRPSPWWARAILCREGAGTRRYLLRSSLVCTPIAREVLLRCFDLEALDRTVCSPHPNANADPESRRRFDFFKSKHPESESLHYPMLCPAAPREPTDFASYGVILSNLPVDPSRYDARHRLRRLRNAVAHGHYISWATLKEMRHVGSRLS